MTQKHLAQGLKAGIVGGSIAGCALAIELTRLGSEVILWERTGDELKDRGAGIGMPPSVVATLVERDLIDAGFHYFPARGFLRKLRSPHGGRAGYLAWEQPTGAALLNWGALYRNLRKRVPDAVYSAGK